MTGTQVPYNNFH